MEKLRNSLPTAKQVLVTIIVCLAIGVGGQGLHPTALLFLLVGLVFLLALTWRNYDPDSYNKSRNPELYRLEAEHTLLYEQLNRITEASENEGIIGTRLMGEQMKSRELLDAIKNQHKPKIESK